MREDLKSIIDKRKEEMDAERKRIADKAASDYEEALNKCDDLIDRIRDLIETANYVKKSGFTFPNSTRMKKYGYGYNAYAESFCHGIGFLSPKQENDDICCMARFAGGAREGYVFYASTEFGFYELYEEERYKDDDSIDSKKRKATIGELSRFAEDFPKFENAFYKWIENGMK